MRIVAHGLLATLVGILAITVGTSARAASETTLYSFCARTSCADGSGPEAGLTNLGGTLYGTTDGGGAHLGGAVFSIIRSGQEKVVYSFVPAGSGSSVPVAPLLYLHGTFYGTTLGGGSFGLGTVFSVTPQGAESTLFSLANGDSFMPDSGLVRVGGSLFGTTQTGGIHGFGTVYSITPAGVEKLVYSFAGGGNGELPYAGLILVGSTLYGTTTRGGAHDMGTVFSVTPRGDEKVLYSFAGGADGAYPYAGLVNRGGELFGTTLHGGTGPAGGSGTVFSVTPQGVERVVYAFKGGRDGSGPRADLLNVGGTLYGTTVQGGGTGCGGLGCGTVFAIAPASAERVVHAFDGPPGDGQAPMAGLIEVGGTLYGTTAGGGAFHGGTVFRIVP